MESVTEEAASTSTAMFNSSDEEQLPSNSSVIPDLSPFPELQSPTSTPLPPLPEFSSPTSTVTLQSPLSVSERESIYEELDALRKERDRLLEENRMLSVKSSGFFSANVIKECPEKCKMLVGFQCSKKIKSSDIKVSGTRPPRAAMEDQIIITLLKLKHNVSFDMLGYMNNVGQSTAADYFRKWIDIMYIKLKFLIRMQDRDYVYDNIPNVFKLKFPRLTSIIDCFEIFVESPSSLIARA